MIRAAAARLGIVEGAGPEMAALQILGVVAELSMEALEAYAAE